MTLKDLSILLADWSDYLVIPVALLSLLTIRRNRYFNILSVYLFLLVPLNVATKITADYQIPNYYLYHMIGLLDLVFTFLLYRSLGLRRSWNGVFGMVLIIYLVDSYSIFAKGKEEINSIGLSLCMLFIIVLGFNFIWKLYREEKVEYLGFYSYFYITGALTVFASGAFFGYLLIARISDKVIPPEIFYYSWIIISGFMYIKFILIVLGIFVERKYAK